MRISCLLALAATGAFAQAPSPATPSPMHEKLAFFEGEWSVAGMEAQQFREVCRWLPEGRRHMTCRSSWRTESGPREGLSIFSYAQETYLYHGFRTGGAVVTQRGHPTPDGWRFESDDGGKRSRVTITATPEGMRFVAETAEPGGAWKASPEVRYIRVK